jgi:hypothetical protein
MELRDLEIGDIFKPANVKSLKGNREYRIEGDPTYLRGNGKHVRRCIDLTNNSEIYKYCWIQVIKTRESNRKQELISKYKNNAFKLLRNVE